MNNTNKQHFLYGLKGDLTKTLVLSVLLSLLSFFVFFQTFTWLLDRYAGSDMFWQTHYGIQLEELQSFIDTNEISSQNLDKLQEWTQKQPLLALEIYNGKELIYSSSGTSVGVEDVKLSTSVNPDEEINASNLHLADMEVSAVLYSDFTYKFYTLATAVSLILAAMIGIAVFMRRTDRIIQYILRLNRDVQILEGGNLYYPVTVQGNDEITELANSVNRMSSSIRDQFSKEKQLHEASRNLVTQMSHDLRTPLTSIMLYVEILRSHRYSSQEQLEDYLEKIDAKAHHLKVLSDNLFKYNLEEGSDPERLSEISKLKTMTLADALNKELKTMTDDLTESGFTIDFVPDWAAGYIQVEPDSISRIVENIRSNLVKYADPAKAIIIDIVTTPTQRGIAVMNSPKDATDVIASGESATESHGIGLKSIKSMMEQMKGSCTVEQTEDLWAITLMWPAI